MTRHRSDERVSLGILPELVGYHLRRAQIAVFQDFAREMASFGVTPGQFGVLQVVAANPGLSQSELAKAIGVDRSTVVAVIDRLEEQDLVVRAPSPTDRRSHALQLSETGRRLVEELVPRVRRHEERIAASLSPRERSRLIELLRRISS
jgi:DNA-binding MarR family transcriptional regulator